MGQYRIARLTLSVAIAVGASGTAHAFSLGQPEVGSDYFEPLSVLIPVDGVAADAAGELEARIASDDVYRRFGLDRSPTLSDVQVGVQADGAGTRVVLTTENPVEETVLKPVIDIRNGERHVVRSYTIMLSPPGQGDGSQGARTDKVVERSTTAVQHNSGSGDGGGWPTQYGPVERGESLWTISRSIAPEGLRTQVAWGMFRNSPDAFVAGDPGRLERGAILEVPTREEARSIDASKAMAELRPEPSNDTRQAQGGSNADSGDSGQTVSDHRKVTIEAIESLVGEQLDARPIEETAGGVSDLRESVNRMGKQMPEGVSSEAVAERVVGELEPVVERLEVATAEMVKAAGDLRGGTTHTGDTTMVDRLAASAPFSAAALLAGVFGGLLLRRRRRTAPVADAPAEPSPETGAADDDAGPSGGSTGEAYAVPLGDDGSADVEGVTASASESQPESRGEQVTETATVMPVAPAVAARAGAIEGGDGQASEGAVPEDAAADIPETEDAPAPEAEPEPNAPDEEMAPEPAEASPEPIEELPEAPEADAPADAETGDDGVLEFDLSDADGGDDLPEAPDPGGAEDTADLPDFDLSGTEDSDKPGEEASAQDDAAGDAGGAVDFDLSDLDFADEPPSDNDGQKG